MTTTANLDALRAEFGHVDMLYVNRHHPHAATLARRYNMARDAINPSVPKTIETARQLLAKLMAATV